MKKFLFILLVIGSILELSSCGQSGPLYLPKEKELSSGSTVMTPNPNSTQQSTHSTPSGQNNTATTKVDNDPTPPAKDNNPTSSQLMEDQDNFSYNKNILDSSEAGGTPTL
jgi:predicted small lipoprotein YifL